MLLALLLVVFASAQFHYQPGSLEVDDDSVQEELGKGPILINFCVPFLASCKEFLPTWNSVIAALPSSSSVRLAHMNIMENHLSKERFGIQDFPVVILIKDGVTFAMRKEGTLMPGVDEIIDFAKFSNDEKGLVKPLAPIPHIPQIFTTHDYTSEIDGKVYPGARF